MEKNKLTVRKTERKDIPLILEFIKKLAEYEKRPQDVTGTEKELEYWLFDRDIAVVLFAYCSGKVVGYSLYYPVFGSFSAAGKVHLEDLYISEEFRGIGLGKSFLAEISKRVLEEGYSGMEWSCLDWNKPSAAFYDRLGAERETGRDYFVFDRQDLERLASLSA